MTIKCDKCGREAAVESESDILRIAGAWDSANRFIYCPSCSAKLEDYGEVLHGYYSTVKTMKEKLHENRAG